MTQAQPVRAEQYLAPETLAQLSPFELRAKMIVEGVMSGLHRSPYHGMAVEFAEHREYVAGDDLRHLDWKVYGRTDKLYIKRYQQETNLDVVLLVDSSASMAFGTPVVKAGWGGTAASGSRAVWTKFDCATALAAAMAYLSLHRQDRVGVCVFADSVRNIVDRSGIPGQWARIVAALSTEPVEAGTDLRKVADQILSRITNRALFVIVSDFFERPQAVRGALARFRHQRHDVILLQALDPREMQFDFAEAAPFDGMEAEGRLMVEPRALREGYLAALREHCASLGSMARSFGFDYQRIDTSDSVGPALAHLLARRNAIIKRSKAG